MRNYDYSLGAAYFITICTDNKEKVLSSIYPDKDYPRIVLTKIGKVVEESLNYIEQLYSGIILDDYIIMPNHIHIILLKTSNNEVVSVSDIIGRFKSYTSTRYESKLWQKSFYDHIIRNKKDYEEIQKYIYNNPINWCNSEI